MINSELRRDRRRYANVLLSPNGSVKRKIFHSGSKPTLSIEFLNVFVQDFSQWKSNFRLLTHHFLHSKFFIIRFAFDSDTKTTFDSIGCVLALAFTWNIEHKLMMFWCKVNALPDMKFQCLLIEIVCNIFLKNRKNLDVLHTTRIKLAQKTCRYISLTSVSHTRER